MHFIEAIRIYLIFQMFEQTNTNVFYLGQTYTNIVMANTSDCLATLNYFSPYWIPNVVKDMNVSMQMVLNVKHNFIFATLDPQLGYDCKVLCLALTRTKRLTANQMYPWLG